MLTPGNRSGRDGGNGNRIDNDAKLAELEGDLCALYEMYRNGELPERVVRLVQQLEDAYWNARLAESNEENTAAFGDPMPRAKSN
jgi:hypothetical protein